MLQSHLSAFESKYGRSLYARRFCNFLMMGGMTQEQLQQKIRNIEIKIQTQRVALNNARQAVQRDRDRNHEHRGFDERLRKLQQEYQRLQNNDPEEAVNSITDISVFGDADATNDVFGNRLDDLTERGLEIEDRRNALRKHMETQQRHGKKHKDLIEQQNKLFKLEQTLHKLRTQLENMQAEANIIDLT